MTIQDKIRLIISEAFDKKFGKNLDKIEIGKNSNYTYGTFKEFCITAIAKIIEEEKGKGEFCNCICPVTFNSNFCCNCNKYVRELK